MAKITSKPGPGAEALKRLIGLDGVQGQVGWFKSAHYQDGTPVAYIAAIQEFGYPAGGIPPRLGMRTTADEKQKEWTAITEQAAKAIIAGNTTAQQAMDQIGLKAAGDIRKHISQVTSPPLQPATIRARIHGRNVGNAKTATKPLVDTGVLLGSVTNRTVKK